MQSLNPIPTAIEQGLPAGITWLNMCGDVTITWDDSNRDAILELVRKKMAEGCHFFVIKPRLLPIFGNSKVSLTSEAQLAKAKGVVVPDKYIHALVKQVDDEVVAHALQNRIAAIADIPRASNHDTFQRAKTAEEVVQHQTVGTRCIVGG